MPHIATVIRDNVVALVTGLPSTGASVFAGRVHALERSDLPCVAVDVGAESAEYVTQGYPRSISATLAIEVTAIVSLAGDFDAALNQIQAEVQAAMAADPTLTNIATNTVYDGRERITDGQGEKPVAALVLQYSVSYRYSENNPQAVP